MPDVLRVVGPNWRLDVTGPRRSTPPFLPAPTTAIRIEGGAVAQIPNSSSEWKNIDPGSFIPPILFENSDYDFYLDSSDPEARLLMPPGAKQRYRGGSVTHYSINFGNDVGMADFVIEQSNTSCRVTAEVFPLKVDYRTDYVQMRDEVARVSRSLALALSRRTYSSAGAVPSEAATNAEWIAILQHYFDQLLAAGRAIAATPHATLQHTRTDVPWRKSRRLDARRLDRRLRRPVGRAALAAQGSEVPIPVNVPEHRRGTSFDNPENRYVQYLLINTIRRLQAIAASQSSGDEDADATAEQAFLASLKPAATDMAQKLRRIALAPFLEKVPPELPKHRFSAVFTSHPHYAAFIRVGRLLNCGLSLGGGPLAIGVKHIAQLYEYWCFLSLVSLLGERFDLQQQNVVQLRHLRFVVVLSKGHTAAVRFRDRDTGRTIALVYNRTFRPLPTIDQRPDNVIQLYEGRRLYVLDAKYRLAYDSDYLRAYATPGPTVADINTMHRYRDAIVEPAAGGGWSPGAVQGAIVLFPLEAEEEYRQHRFCRSIAFVDIGGLPFLPGAKTLVTDHVGRILAEGGFWAAAEST